MINQNLLYGLILFILAYMRINPGKNILCYIILFLIALVILYPVEGWSTGDDDLEEGTNIFYDFEVVVESSDGSSINEGELLSLSDGQSVKLKFKYNVSTTEYTKIAGYTEQVLAEVPENIVSYRNIINLLANNDDNQSNLRYKLSAYNGTTNEGTTIAQATAAVTAAGSTVDFDTIDVDISIFDMTENVTCKVDGNNCLYSNINPTEGIKTLHFSVDLTNKITTALGTEHQAKIFKLEYAPTCVIEDPTPEACENVSPTPVELNGSNGEASGCTVRDRNVILPVLQNNVVENYYNGWTITMGTAEAGTLVGVATGVVSESTVFDTGSGSATGPTLTVVWDDPQGTPGNGSQLAFNLSPVNCSTQGNTAEECSNLYPSCRIADSDSGGLATCGGNGPTMGAIRNAYNNTTGAPLQNCGTYNGQSALTEAETSTCNYTPEDGGPGVINFKITKTTGSTTTTTTTTTTTDSATPCRVTGTVVSGGTCDDSCTADKRCSGDLVCSGDSTDSARTCVEASCRVTGTVVSGGTCDDSCTANMTCAGDLICSGTADDSDRTCIDASDVSDESDIPLWVWGLVVALVLGGLYIGWLLTHPKGDRSVREADHMQATFES
jgi:hypothetical protein